MSLAVLCQKIEREPNGLTTLRGLYEGLVLPMAAPRALLVRAVIIVHGGHLVGDHVVGVRLLDPEGQPASGHVETTEHFTGVAHAMKAEFERFVIFPSAAGVYWFEVLFDGHVLLRRPFVVGFSRTRA